MNTLSRTDSFWQNLPKPIIGLSPMDGVTDQPYRHIQKKYGMPAVVYTEFTSVEGVCHKAERLMRDFLYDETQRPIVAQIYGTTPEFFRQTTIVLCQLGFDGIDINMGCPAKNVAHSGAGAALIKTPVLAKKIIQATQQGVKDWQNGQEAKDCPDISQKITKEIERRAALLPGGYQQRRHVSVTVKTRVGFDQKVTRDWITTLLEEQPEVIAIHGRTLKQAYGGEADWEEIAQAADLSHQFAQENNLPRTLILGNGDVKTYAQALERVKKYGVDGVLIGRASFGNPFVFAELYPENHPSLFQIALEHAQIYEKTYASDPKNTFLPMRKHLGWYVKNLEGAKEIRFQLFQTNTSKEVAEIFKKYNLL